MKKLLLLAAGLFLLISVVWFLLISHYPTTSSSKSAIYFVEHLFKPHASMTTQTLGFLPYWRVDDIQYAKLNLLSEVNYFGLNLDKSGHLVTEVNGKTDPGWNGWNNQKVNDFIAESQIMGTNFSLTIVSQ